MNFKSIHFFWSTLTITLIAFTFSLFANPTTDANSNTHNDNPITPDIHSLNVEVTEGSGQDTGPRDKAPEKVVRDLGAESKGLGTKDARITQTEDEHVKKGNGSMFATDVVTTSGDAYFPTEYSEYYVYFIGYDARIGNYIIIRHDKERWVYGHTVTSRNVGEYVQSTGTNNTLGQYNSSGMSTAKHVHIERWICPDKQSKMKECSNVSSTGEVSPRNKELKEQRGWVQAEVQNNLIKENKTARQVSVGSGEIRVIKCLNEKDMTLHDTKGGMCFLGNGGKWKNIMLPPQKDIDMFKKIFGEDYKYRLAIANFEGSFREDNGNPYAHGYLQTLRSYKIPPDIESQLNWLAKREIGNTGPACEKYLTENFTLFGTMDIEKGKIAKYTCMGRRHFGAFSPGDNHYPHSVMYAKRYRVATEYYLSLDF